MEKRATWPEWACTTTMELQRYEPVDPSLQWAWRALGVSVIVAVSMVASAVLN